MFKLHTAAALIALAIAAPACTSATAEEPETETGTLTSPLTELDRQVDALRDARDAFERDSDGARDASDLRRVTDVYRDDSDKRVDRIRDILGDMSDCARDGDLLQTDTMERRVSDISDAVHAVDSAIRDAADLDLARSDVSDHLRIVDAARDAFGGDISNLSDAAHDYVCSDIGAYVCDDDPNTDDCAERTDGATDATRDHAHDGASDGAGDTPSDSAAD